MIRLFDSPLDPPFIDSLRHPQIQSIAYTHYIAPEKSTFVFSPTRHKRKVSSSSPINIGGGSGGDVTAGVNGDELSTLTEGNSPPSSTVKTVHIKTHYPPSSDSPFLCSYK